MKTLRSLNTCYFCLAKTTKLFNFEVKEKRFRVVVHRFVRFGAVYYCHWIDFKTTISDGRGLVLWFPFGA